MTAGPAGRRLLTALLGITVVAAGCGTARQDYIAGLASGDPALGLDGSPDPNASLDAGAGETAPPVLPPTPAQIGLQLATFFGPEGVGVYDADVQGFYRKLAIEVGVVPGAPDQDPLDQLLQQDGPDVLLAPVAYVLQADEAKKADLVEIAQLFQRSGTEVIAPTSVSLESVSRLKGKTVGVLDLGGRAMELQSVLAAAGLAKGSYRTTGGYDFVADPSSIPVANLLRSGAVTAVEGTTYDEYAQLLEFGTDDGHDPYQPAQLTTVPLDEAPGSLLGMGFFVRASWLADPANKDAAVRFLRATFAGYEDCRSADSNQDCAQTVVDQGNPLPLGHQQWAVNEVNALIWPSPGGVGSLPPGALASTVAAMRAAGLLTADPTATFDETELATEARAAEKSLDLVGSGFSRITVPITPGGVGLETPPPLGSDDPNASGDPNAPNAGAGATDGGASPSG